MKKRLLILATLLFLVVHTTIKAEESYALILNSISFHKAWIMDLSDQIETNIQNDYPNLHVSKEALNIPLIEDETGVEDICNRLRTLYSTPPQVVFIVGDPGYIVCSSLFEREWKDVPTIVYHASKLLPKSMKILIDKEILNDTNSISSDEFYKDKNVLRLETPFFVKETIEAMNQVIPNMNRLFLVSDHRFISMELRKQANEVMQKYFPNITLTHLSNPNINTEKLINIISLSDSKTGIIYYSWYNTPTERKSYMVDNIQKVVCAFSKTPVFTLYDWSDDLNHCVGGHYTSLSDNAEAVCYYMKQALDGKSFANKPMVSIDKAQTYLNYNKLIWYGLNPEQFPKDKVVYLEVPPTFYQKHMLTIWTGIVLLALLSSVYIYYKIRNIRLNRQNELIARLKREKEEEYRIELEELTRKYRLVIQAVDLLTWTIDIEKNEITYEKKLKVSNQIEKLNYQEIIKRLLPEDRNRVREAMRKLINGESDLYHEEYCIRSNNEESYHWEESFAIVSQRDPVTDSPSVIVGATMFINERKEMEEKLINAKEKAVESDRLKSAFLANMSHEIRTPLNAIVGFSNILAETEDINDRKEFYNIIKNNNDLLLQLINDILDLAKIDAGTLEFTYAQVDINELLQQIAEQGIYLNRNNSGVELRIEGHLENSIITTDRNRITQVLCNFLNNAIKFTSKGSITIGYREEVNDQLYFYVTDTGCGIPEDKQPMIFGRFVKLNNFSQGTGLGLSICQTIIHKLQGQIGLISKEGEGSTFWFRIPRNLKEEPLKNIDDNEMLPEQKQKPKILIAEDNPGNYKLFETILQKDYELIHAWDGKEAVELFKKHLPHLVLMDIMLPILNGYEATKEIRKISYIVPIIAVSAYTDKKELRKLGKSSFSDFEPKPINAKSLTDKIATLLKDRMLSS